ncbi:MAG: hypothetical protein IKV55_01025 [Oscillospiraceae bacterium]|nr:hypothetical protein [Oscillospiraceae bacterium]
MQSENKKLNECLHAAFPLPELPQSLCAEVVSERLAGKKPHRAVPLYVVRTAAAAAVCLFAVGLALMLPLLSGGGMGGAAAESERAAAGGADAEMYGYYDVNSDVFAPDIARSDDASVLEDSTANAPMKNEPFSYAADMCMQLAVGERVCIALDGPAGNFIIRYTDCETGAENNAVCSAWFTAVDGEGLLLWVEGTAEGAVTLQMTELLLLDHDTPREYTLSVIVEGEVPHAD